jgi:hypothetical protein
MANTVIDKTTTSTGKHEATLYNKDKVTVTYNTEETAISKVDLLRVNGNLVDSGYTFDVDKDVTVNVVAMGEPVSLAVNIDAGVNFLRVHYTDINGQARNQYFQDSASYTITDI